MKVREVKNENQVGNKWYKNAKINGGRPNIGSLKAILSRFNLK